MNSSSPELPWGSGYLSHEAGARLREGDALIPLNVTMSHDQDDPLAVSFAFDVGADKPVEWLLDRDLLRRGLEEPAGIGDVKVQPANDGEDIQLDIASPFGEASFWFTRTDIETFVKRVYRAVPEGSEVLETAVSRELETLFYGL